MFDIEMFQELWFFLVAILFAGYSILDGFDLGIGSLLAVLGKTKEEKDTLINSIGPVMSIDVDKRSSRLGEDNPYMWLSGPAVKPIALRCTYEVLQAVKCPVIGIGGITDALDALEFLLLGAKAVQVGTANFINPSATLEIVEGLAAYLAYYRTRALAQA